jgi:4-amino-4-deoxy-L-arabinose transferase-like glycosyltransferase
MTATLRPDTAPAGPGDPAPGSPDPASGRPDPAPGSPDPASGRPGTATAPGWATAGHTSLDSLDHAAHQRIPFGRATDDRARDDRATDEQAADHVDERAATDRLSAAAPITTASPAGPTSGGLSTLGTRLLRGRPDDPAWARPVLLGLLAATAVLYMWGLGASGWANSFYSAAVQAGSESWKAFFFGSSDAANSITVDKPPASLWFMALSVRVFGLSSWSILLPQALMGVASVGVLYGAVRRWFTPQAALLAGAALALTPVATLMFRFNNPDALLTLVMTIAVYAVVRAIEDARVRWLALAGALVGFGFLTKQLQVLLVVPALGLAYLVAAPTSFGRRIRDLLIAFAAMIGAAGWWPAIVELTPTQYRPYIGGSQDNSILELTLGYNGLGRLTGEEVGSVGGGGGGNGGMWGETGLLRMFNSEMGGQIAWLIPAALILLAAGLVVTRNAPRTDRTRAALLLWGGWLLVTGLVFSLMQGIFHAYYTVALAPAVAALVGIGATLLWQQRNAIARYVLAGTVVVTALWAYLLLGRSADWHPWLRVAILLVGLGAAAGLAVGDLLGRRALAAVAAAAVITGLAGPVAYSLNTAATPKSGSIVTAGPAVAGAMGGPGGMRGPGGAGGPGGMPPGGQGGFAPPQGLTGQTPFGQGQTGQGQTGQGQTGGRGGMGGLLNGSTPSAELLAALRQDAGSYTWVAAAIGSNNASGYQLASEEPVMAIGGFNGSDPSPTLAQFQQYVEGGQIHYFIASGGFGGGSRGGSDASSEISTWVQENYPATTIGGTTVYDLTASSGSTGGGGEVST